MTLAPVDSYNLSFKAPDILCTSLSFRRTSPKRGKNSLFPSRNLPVHRCEFFCFECMFRKQASQAARRFGQGFERLFPFNGLARGSLSPRGAARPGRGWGRSRTPAFLRIAGLGRRPFLPLLVRVPASSAASAAGPKGSTPWEGGTASGPARKRRAPSFIAPLGFRSAVDSSPGSRWGGNVGPAEGTRGLVLLRILRPCSSASPHDPYEVSCVEGRRTALTWSRSFLAASATRPRGGRGSLRCALRGSPRRRRRPREISSPRCPR